MYLHNIVSYGNNSIFYCLCFQCLTGRYRVTFMAVYTTRVKMLNLSLTYVYYHSSTLKIRLKVLLSILLIEFN